MFEAMGIDTTGETWRASAERHLQEVLAGDEVVAAVVDAPGGGLAAGGVVEFLQWIPSPSSPFGRAAYISNISTDVPWRRRGLARAVLDELLVEARRRDVERVELHATAEGIGLYRSVGFVPREGNPAMRLANPLSPPVDRPDR